ncbi:large ribosomal subunit protein mL40-like [Saccostrea echinata]|uniref:large ribosomal subunit protein mL40-like n=1 Tax=Saccostrea echinata TaxID=191078 RepID=UPI002A813739|nr:large ribosomal subunit protein mL40-like [Saccostrea echinata]
MAFSSFKICARLFQESALICNSFHTCSPQYFHDSRILSSMPTKRKVKIDPRILIEKEQRKRKKIENELRRLERKEGTLKPIDEYDSVRKLKRQVSDRARPIPELPKEEVLRRIQLEKDWCHYTTKQYRALSWSIHQATKFSAETLVELRKESEELYVQAIQEDPNLLSYSKSGPSLTPPIKDYNFPDGEYSDVTKVW